MIECRHDTRPGRLPDDVLALRIVAAQDLVVVEEVDVGTGHRAVGPFETVGLERPALLRAQVPCIEHGHPAAFKIGTFPAAVIAAAVTAGEHLAVAVERRFR